MRSKRFVLVAPNYGRSISDDRWETIDLQHIAIWQKVVDEFGVQHMQLLGAEYSVTMDWSQMLRQHKQHFSTLRKLSRHDRPTIEIMMKAAFPRRASRNEITVSTGMGDMRRLAFLAESAVYDVFLVTNIASPSACDLLGASLVPDQDEPFDIPTKISLSNVLFETALLHDWQHGWPRVQPLDFARVASWYRSVHKPGSLIPQNPMERALFALLHLASIDVSPMIVVWQFYALEALLQTRVGENLNSLIRRTALLLEPNDKQMKLLRKQVRELYEIRSAVVHGGFEIVHPLNNEQIDRKVNDVVARLLQAADFGNALLVSLIQETISRGWRFPVFDESIRGDTSESP